MLSKPLRTKLYLHLSLVFTVYVAQAGLNFLGPGIVFVYHHMQQNLAVPQPSLLDTSPSFLFLAHTCLITPSLMLFFITTLMSFFSKWLAELECQPHQSTSCRLQMPLAAFPVFLDVQKHLQPHMTQTGLLAPLILSLQPVSLQSSPSKHMAPSLASFLHLDSSCPLLQPSSTTGSHFQDSVNLPIPAPYCPIPISLCCRDDLVLSVEGPH